MVVRGGDIDPASTGDCPDDIVSEEEFCKAVGSAGGDVPEDEEVPEVADHQARA